MTCMKQEFCIHEKYCQRHIGQNFDSCILFSRNSKPQTNEEHIKSLNTEQLADKLTDFSFWLVPNLPKEDKREQVRKWIENWLKEIHK